MVGKGFQGRLRWHHGGPRPPVTTDGRPWSTGSPVGVRGLPVAARGCPWLPVAARGRPWPPVAARGRPWPLVAVCGRSIKQL